MKKRLKKILMKELLIIIAGLTAYAVYVNRDTILEKFK
jgi:hypothetical protein